MVARTEPVLIQSPLSQHNTCIDLIRAGQDSATETTCPLIQQDHCCVWLRWTTRSLIQLEGQTAGSLSADSVNTCAEEKVHQDTRLYPRLNHDRLSGTTRLLLRHCSVSNGSKPMFTGVISGWSTNSVNLHHCKFFSTLHIAFAVLNRRPYYRSVADCRVRNKLRSWQSSRCSPQTRSGSLETSAGGCDRESGFCASTEPKLYGFTCLCVRWATGPSKRVTLKGMLCTLEYVSQSAPYGKYTGSGALNRILMGNWQR